MARRDYVLRMIEQMARVLARVRRMLTEGRYAEAEDELSLTARQAGIDLGMLVALSKDTLVPLLTTGGETDRAKCALFAEVLYLDWCRARAQGRVVDAERRAERATWLFGLAYQGTLMDQDAVAKVEEMRDAARAIADDPDAA